MANAFSGDKKKDMIPTAIDIRNALLPNLTGLFFFILPANLP
jgi:hypothetical protein